MNEQSKKEMAEALWAEINRAIFNSSRVRDCLNLMKEKGTLDYLCEHDFLLNSEQLIEEMLNEPYRLDELGSKLGESIEMFLEAQDQSPSSVNNTIFPKGFFSVN